MKLLVGVFLLLAGTVLPSLSQVLLSLGPTEVYRISGVVAGGVYPYRCDSSGSIYGRFESAGPSKFDLLKISADGQHTTSFPVPSTPELKYGTVTAFDPYDGVNIYELVQLGTERTYILDFSADGTLRSRTELQVPEPMRLTQLAVASPSSFFVSGTVVGSSDGKSAGAPFNALFDATGKLLRKITLKNDSQPGKQPKQADPNGLSNLAVSFGRAVAGHDGSVYVLRAATPARLIVISASGDILRVLPIEPPTPGSEPFEMQISGGRIAVEFDSPDAKDISGTRIRVIDSQTGEALNDYKITRELTEAMACYTPEAFTFYSNTSEFPSIVVAAIPH